LNANKNNTDAARMHCLTLRFTDAAMETAFSEEQAKKSLRPIRIALVCAGALVLFFLWPVVIWGDTVNVASRMESAGEAGRVNVSAYTFDLIGNEFTCEYRGKVSAKGKGEIDMYFVTGAR
jgi:class 3 adenylate cyclase